jgi:phosphoribosylformimino-5-aminoimidazole carboxamide ribotide isomerase
VSPSQRFDVIPAIDVMDGRLARMRAGDPSSVRTDEGDPLSLAERFVEEGAEWIHLVDLNSALEGTPQNLGLLERVARLPVRVQAGGGLSPEGVAAALDRGADRAVLGAGTLSDLEIVRRTVDRFGRRVGVGLDVRGGVVAPRGSTVGGPPVERVLSGLASLRPAFVVYTEVERDGMAAGPPLEALAAVAEAVGVPVLASGGIRSVEDILALGRTTGVEGAILGRALHEGAFTLAKALAAAAEDAHGR